MMNKGRTHTIVTHSRQLPCSHERPDGCNKCSNGGELHKLVGVELDVEL